MRLQKKDRAAFAGGPSLGRKRLGEGERHGDVAGSISHFEKPHALTALNLLGTFAMCAGRVVNAPGQSNTDTHQGVDRSLDAPSTGTRMAEASRNGQWQRRK
jgi:hypothetical protein